MMGMSMDKCVVCGRWCDCSPVADASGECVTACAKCRRRYFPTREERRAERQAERMADDGLWTSESGISNALCNLAMPIALVVVLVVFVVVFDIPVDWGYLPRILGL